MVSGFTCCSCVNVCVCVFVCVTLTCSSTQICPLRDDVANMTNDGRQLGDTRQKLQKEAEINVCKFSFSFCITKGKWRGRATASYRAICACEMTKKKRGKQIGNNFQGNLYQSLCKILSIQRCKSTVCGWAANTLERGVEKIKSNTKRNWRNTNLI